jgi:hypothetical protein
MATAAATNGAAGEHSQNGAGASPDERAAAIS